MKEKENMQDYREKLKSTDATANAICIHLIGICDSDQDFKSDVETKDDRNVSGMMKYIENIALKMAKGNQKMKVTVTEDQTVYNWAFDYFHDKDISNVISKEQAKELKNTVKAKTVKVDAKQEEKHVEMIDLFSYENN